MGIFQLCNIFAENFFRMRILGMGNALTDVLAILPSDQAIHDAGLLKGGMELINEDKLLKLMSLFEDFDTFLAGGGSAANAMAGLARMGISCGFIGKVGHDSYGAFYKEDLIKNGVTPFLLEGDLPSGCAMTMITPGGERTFGTYLGAAATLSAADLCPEMFTGYDLLHIEGYLIQDPDLIRRAVALAKSSGLKISLDMSSYNIVKTNLIFFRELLDATDIVFGNEEEAYAYTGSEPEKAAEILSRQCEIAVVKKGPQGSVVRSGEEVCHIGILPGACKDSTGAGDLYAAGFLYGLSNKYSLCACGELGAILAGNVIQVIGPRMDDAHWDKIKLKVRSLFGN